jgi:hypothetical protein
VGETNISDFEVFQAVSACPGITNVDRRQGKALRRGLRYLQDKEAEKEFTALDRNSNCIKVRLCFDIRVTF